MASDTSVSVSAALSRGGNSIYFDLLQFCLVLHSTSMIVRRGKFHKGLCVSRSEIWYQEMKRRASKEILRKHLIIYDVLGTCIAPFIHGSYKTSEMSINDKT